MRLHTRRWRLRTPRSESASGQSLVELALVLPFLLAFAGGATDLARAYQAQLTLESAVRNAAEYVATNSADATTASSDAMRVVCLESRNVPGFSDGVGPNPVESCSAPAVSVDAFTLSTTDLGATPKNPIGTAQIAATIDFQTLVPYPFLPRGFTLNAETSFSVVRGR